MAGGRRRRARAERGVLPRVRQAPISSSYQDVLEYGTAGGGSYSHDPNIVGVHPAYPPELREELAGCEMTADAHPHGRGARFDQFPELVTADHISAYAIDPAVRAPSLEPAPLPPPSHPCGSSLYQPEGGRRSSGASAYYYDTEERPELEGHAFSACHVAPSHVHGVMEPLSSQSARPRPQRAYTWDDDDDASTSLRI